MIQKISTSGSLSLFRIRPRDGMFHLSHFMSPLSLLVSAATMALGACIVASPVRAARVWGWKRLNELTPARRALYLRAFRVMGLMIGLTGILFAIDTIWFQ